MPGQRRPLRPAPRATRWARDAGGGFLGPLLAASRPRRAAGPSWSGSRRRDPHGRGGTLATEDGVELHPDSLADAAFRRSSRGPVRGTTSHGQSAHVAVDRRRLPYPSPARPPTPTPATTAAAPAWPSSALRPVGSATTHPPSLRPTRPSATPDTPSGDSGGPSGLPRRPSAIPQPQAAATALVLEAYVQAAARAEKRPRQQGPPPEPRSARRPTRRPRTNSTPPEPPRSPARQRPEQHGAPRSQSHRPAALAVADHAWGRPSLPL